MCKFQEHYHPPPTAATPVCLTGLGSCRHMRYLNQTFFKLRHCLCWSFRLKGAVCHKKEVYIFVVYLYLYGTPCLQHMGKHGRLLVGGNIYK